MESEQLKQVIELAKACGSAEFARDELADRCEQMLSSMQTISLQGTTFQQLAKEQCERADKAEAALTHEGLAHGRTMVELKRVRHLCEQASQDKVTANRDLSEVQIAFHNDLKLVTGERDDARHQLVDAQRALAETGTQAKASASLAEAERRERVEGSERYTQLCEDLRTLLTAPRNDLRPRLETFVAGLPC